MDVKEEEAYRLDARNVFGTLDVDNFWAELFASGGCA